jgi:hypothetical protein
LLVRTTLSGNWTFGRGISSVGGEAMTACERQLLLELARREIARSDDPESGDALAEKRLRYLIGKVQERHDGEADPWALVPIF